MGTTEYTYVTNYITYGYSDEEIENLKKKYEKAFDAMVKDMEAKNSDFKTQIEISKNEIKNLEDTINSLQKEFQNDIKKQKKENKDLKLKILNLKELLSQSTYKYEMAIKKNKEIEKALNNEKQRADKFLNKWIEAKEELKKEKQKVIELEKKDEVKNLIIKFLDNQIQNLKNDCVHYKEQIESLKNDYLKKADEIKGEINDLKKSNKELTESLNQN